MRIWLRDAGRLGFVPRIRDDAQEVVTVTVIDLDSVPERELGTVDIAVGGDPVTFQTSVPFQIAVPRIVTLDPVAAAQLRAQELERVEQVEAVFGQLRQILERQRANTREQIMAALDELKQAVASTSDQVWLVEGTEPGQVQVLVDETTSGALMHQFAELEELLRLLTEQLQLRVSGTLSSP